jgi:hypothetical protein
MRLHRGSLESEQDDNGRTFVLLPRDNSDTTAGITDDRTELVDELRNRIASLEQQLGQEREANRENRRLLAAALERIPPQLEAPSEAPRSGETGAEEPYSTHAPSEPREWSVRHEGETYGTSPQEAENSLHRGERSWWRRFFGFE